MTPPAFIDNDDLWPMLKGLHKETKRRSIVAVPYVGRGAARRLPLRKGDVLICALSLANARAGNVCPAELRIFQKKGVRVFVRPHLHAKVYLFGESALISSANLSSSSETRLDECGVLVRGRKTIRGIKEWLRERMIDPLREHWLERCESAYRPPSKGASDRSESRRVWLIGTEPAEFPDEENAAWQEGLKAAKERMTRQERSYVDSIRWTAAGRFAREIAAEDHVVQIHDDDGDSVVYPHGTVLNVRRIRRSGAAYVYLELPSNHRMYRWADFRNESKRMGLKLPKAVVSRLVPAAFADRILRWTNLGA